MSTPAIRVEGLCKTYEIGARQAAGATFRETVTEALAEPVRRLLGRSAATLPTETFEALRDVSFEVEPGEVVGIIGRNGAGKSTLLKVLSRITAPTKGRVEIRGRIASLLEVGTGFHPELTGRENIRLNGAILGMSGAEIRSRFDEIVDFSGVEKFLDTPVKRYSSGMYVRLAFAVAAHLEPEILLVDEVLAVGDAEVQKKCLGKMQDVAKGGRTVLFVSHNMAAVKALCSRAVLLKSGEVVASGQTDTVITYYASRIGATSRSVDLSQAPRRATSESNIAHVEIAASAHNAETMYIFDGMRIKLRIRTTDSPSVPASSAWLLIRNAQGDDVVMIMQKDSDGFRQYRDNDEITCELTSSLTPGRYALAVGLLGQRGEVLDWVDDAIRFDIAPAFADGAPFDHRLGLTTMKGHWSALARGEA